MAGIKHRAIAIPHGRRYCTPWSPCSIHCDVMAALARNEEERDALVTIHKGFEAWLRLNGKAGVTLPLPVVAPAPAPNGKPVMARHAIKGKISVRQAVLQVL